MSVYGGIKAVPIQRDDDDAFLRGQVMMLIYCNTPSNIPPMTHALTHLIMHSAVTYSLNTLSGHDEDVDIDDELPENKFHLKLPKDVDQYTGASRFIPLLKLHPPFDTYLSIRLVIIQYVVNPRR